MKVKFVKSPTGKYSLGYSAGHIADINDKEQAKEMIESGFAIPLTADDDKETATATAAGKETRTTKK